MLCFQLILQLLIFECGLNDSDVNVHESVIDRLIDIDIYNLQMLV